jgi:hypothetical protein
VTDALAGWEHGRSAAEREASREIAEQSLGWLREYDRAAQKMDVPLDEWAKADPEGRKPDSLWETVVREAWAHAVKQGAVEKPHSRAYRWVRGDDDE